MALYEAMGGAAACRNLAVAFYGRVGRDPLLRPLFPGKTLHCAIEEFTAFLIQFLGGPPEETHFRHWLSLRDSHSRFRLGGPERDAWMALMTQALEEVDMPQPARQGLRAFFEQSSRYLIGSETSGDALDPELAAHWHVQLSLDDAVAAVRAGDVDRALSLADPACGPSRFAALLAVMLAAGNPPLVRYVRDRVASDPALARERFNGRTLLHAAAAAGDADTLDLLLRLGGDPGARDGGGHTPLYSVANECSVGGAAVVHLLARAGASLDAADGVKRATPLHMAARRGSVEIAAALLDCGARIEARDSLGETPLRRAVNCGKVDVARLLLERGADPDSLGSKRLTPRLAARTGAMRQLLREASPR